MRNIVAIAIAEMRQDRLVVGVGLVLGILPLALHYLVYGERLGPQVSGGHSAFADSLIWIFAIVLSVAVAVARGAGAVAPDLRDRRLGFWLARPVPILHYWAGKMAAAWLLAVAAAVLVMLPAHLLGAFEWSATAASLGKAWEKGGWLVGLALAAGAAGAAAGALRAPSRLLWVDVVMLPLTWLAFMAALGYAWQSGTLVVMALFVIPWLLRGAALVLLAAGAAQVAVGRLDLRRGHAVLSAIAWPGLLLLVLGGIVGVSRYVVTRAPSDLLLPQATWLHAPAGGGHVFLEGLSRRWDGHYEAGYLVAADGSSIPIGGLEGLTGFAWSPGGTTFAWSRELLGPQEDRENLPGWGPVVWVRRLDPTGSGSRMLTLDSDATVVAVSPSGERLLLSSGEGMTLLSAESGAPIAGVPQARWMGARFLDETHVRALRRDGAGIRIVDWDGSSGAPADGAVLAGAVASLEGYWLRTLWPLEDWRYILREDASGLHVHRLDGSALTLVDAWQPHGSRTAGPVSGARVGCIEGGDDGVRLRVFGMDGQAQLDVRLPGRFPVHVGGEPVAGLLAVGVVPDAAMGGRETLHVDLSTGRIQRRERGVSPALRAWSSVDQDRTYPEPGSLATRLVYGDDGLLALDPETGSRTLLVARQRLDVEE